MLPFAPARSVFQEQKCHFTHGLVGHIDASQPPAVEAVAASQSLSQSSQSFEPNAEPNADTDDDTATPRRLRKPWSAIQALGFVSQVDIVLPADAAPAVLAALADRRGGRPQYARVTMTLRQVLEGAFYAEYVQTGRVLLLSQGRAGQDSVAALRHGRLTLFLARQAYESSGLQGTPHGATGGRHLRPRWIVECDLHARTMRPGQPGHARLLRAADRVFATPTTWLCTVLDPSPDPLDAFAPKRVTVTPTVLDRTSVALPPLVRPPSLLAVDRNARMAMSDTRLAAEEDAAALYEWLSLVRLGSPRIDADDNIDPYLCRYTVPGATNATTGDVCTLRWTGFLSPTWACQTLLNVLLATQSATPSQPVLPSPSTRPPPAWFALSATGFAASKGLAGDTPECTVFRPADAPHEFLLWDIHSHE